MLRIRAASASNAVRQFAVATGVRVASFMAIVSAVWASSAKPSSSVIWALAMFHEAPRELRTFIHFRDILNCPVLSGGIQSVDFAIIALLVSCLQRQSA
jgi:hypothetical protein